MYMKQNIDEGLLSDMGYKLFKRTVCSKLKKAGFDLEQYADQIEDWCQDWYQDGFDASDAFASLRDTLIRNGAVTESTDLNEGAQLYHLYDWQQKAWVKNLQPGRAKFTYEWDVVKKAELADTFPEMKARKIANLYGEEVLQAVASGIYESVNEAYGQSDKEILADPDFWEYSRKVQEGWKKYGGTIFKKEDVATLRKDKAFKKSLKDEYIRRPTAYIDRFNSDFVEAEILRMYKKGYSAEAAVRELSDISCDASYMSDTEWEKSRKFHYNIQHGIFEDFSMGVGAPCGLDQGIPHGGDCKGCNPCRVAMVGHPASKPPRSAALALTPGYWLNQIPKKKKKKVKKMKKRNLRKEAYEYLRPLPESEDMNEGVLAIAGGVALGLIALKALKTVCGIGKDVLQGVAEGFEEGMVPALIEKNKVEIAEEIKNSIMNDSLYGEEVRKDLENKSLTKEKIKTVLQKQLHMGPLGRQKFTNKALDRAADSYHSRKLRLQGWRSGNGSFRETHDDIKFTDSILEKLTDITYAAIIDVKEEMTESYKLTESYGSDFEDFKEEVIEAMGINRAIAKKLVNKFEDDIIAEFESTMDADKIAYDIVEYYYDKIG